MSPDAIEDALASIELEPSSRWPELLAARFADDPELARQALIWLVAGQPAEDLPTLDGGDRFDLGGCLGRGSTATVWQAYDRRLERHVALKVFRDSASSSVARSLAEARASSEVISEHVVRVYDVHGGAAPYLVLELVGEQTDGRLELGAAASSVQPRDVNEAVRWVRDVARGVADAHLHDVFHRDLKPQNVLITPRSRRAKIADFGLAITPAAAMRAGGTPQYIAPELASTRAEPGRRGLVAIDVWGLGALAYALLAGVPPWNAKSGIDAWDLAASGIRPPALVQTTRGELLPPRLRKVLERSLALEPTDRYTSARDLADELDAFLARRPTTFDRGAGVRIGLWARRNPHLTMTSVVAIALALMTTAAFATVARMRRRSREIAVEMDEVERDKAALAKRNQVARDELATIEATLTARSSALAELHAKLEALRVEAASLASSKDQLLKTATTTTQQLTTVQSDRDTAELARALYERFWSSAREDARAATAERDTARQERELARQERDRALSALASEKTARTDAEHDRDAARARVDEMRRSFDARLATVGSCPASGP